MNSVLLEHFADCGNMAPSSHNAKMWKVKVDADNHCIIVSLKEKALLSKVDPENREAWISAGAFTQNVRFVASDYGYRAVPVLKNNSCVCIGFEKKNASKKAEYETLLYRRRTTRTPLIKIELPTELKECIEKDLHLRYVSHDDEIFPSLAELSAQANEQQINNQEKREELARWINFKNTARPGLTLEKLGLNSVERFFLRHFVGFRSFCHGEFVRKKMIRQSRKLCWQTSGYLIISSERESIEDWWKAGQLLEKVWILLTKHGIKVHPLSQVIEEEPFYSQLKKKIDLRGEVQMVLRIGG